MWKRLEGPGNRLFDLCSIHSLKYLLLAELHYFRLCAFCSALASPVSIELKNFALGGNLQGLQASSREHMPEQVAS